VCGNGTWTKGLFKAGPGEPTPVAASGAWTSDDTFTAVLCLYRTPFIDTHRVRFTGDEAELTTHMNVGFGGNKDIVLVGKAQP
jgi:hypothetical protein